MKEFNSIEEMKPYYDEEKNLFYIEDDIKLNFDLKCFWNIDALNINALNINARDIDALNIDARDIKANDIDALNINALNINAWDIDALNIDARNINARDIDALNIDARNINARDIKANDINYYAVCFAYKNIRCSSIKGRREHSRHFVLDGEIYEKPRQTESN